MKFKIWDRKLKFSLKTKELVYEDVVFKPIIKTYLDMKKMYLKNTKIKDDFPLYFIFKDVFFSKNDKKEFKKHNIRYDVTVIVPKSFQDECNKTFGHFHSENKSWKKYQEVYEVLYWKAIYLQQNDKEVFYTSAKAWKKVVMEESFWHIIVNSNDERLLITANLINDTCEYNCDIFSELNGWNYFYLNSWWVKNPSYKNELKIVKKNNKFKWWNIYDDFIKKPEKFGFLN